MWNAIETFLDSMFVGPMWPASVLMGLLICYLLLSILGAVDLDMDSPDADVGLDLDVPDGGIDLPESPDADFDVDFESNIDVGHGASDIFGGVGMLTLRWLNLGRVPIIMWAGTFTLLYWTVTWILWSQSDNFHYQPTLWISLLLTIRNIVIAVGLTKIMTGPMAKVFAPEPQFDAAHLMGRDCTVCTFRADSSFGQGRYKTDASPLLLNIRTDGAILSKGEQARIIGFDPVKRIYIVTKVDPEVLP